MIAIIPARSGSKGLPGKNIKLLEGKPMIAYTIEAALKAKKVEKVIVSTNSDEIAQISLKHGAEVPFLRPEHLASDTALAIDNYIYTIDKLNDENNCSIENLIVLQPTSPLRTSVDIDLAIELFDKKEADSVVSYCKEAHPIKWHKHINGDGLIIPIFDEKLSNRQEELPTFYPNGAIFIFKYSFLKSRKYYSDKSYAYIMDRKNSIDIDFMEDFEYAEYLLKKDKN
ncbi:cytidylyltransferase domain-containing protein [Polaribacter dokdonensis]|uniref:N-acylneuraminate cytidylyltransferase n=1 Tax=Polaribacter dokdonensis DSW-5 TaxID=1300348 RepID=A0A0M9CED1_9FLAO|nr:acylneuraminate cytidylyltransferase family protein [Polaribacter dokdonensis]KOY50666.1 N-acylneuraminate cytidylyltransferase [Polaribacter dokdonensis DSW-5]SEE62463.1 N-acylneuraminate cytidylyltransferase/CMP-N,N'-diacetyllegionaminic acid synthase [Polaribacter dokdonensis DSW-5]